jgi:hypothetical protein
MVRPDVVGAFEELGRLLEDDERIGIESVEQLSVDLPEVDVVTSFEFSDAVGVPLGVACSAERDARMIRSTSAARAEMVRIIRRGSSASNTGLRPDEFEEVFIDGSDRLWLREDHATSPKQ